MEREGPTLRRNDGDKSQEGSFSKEGPLSQDGEGAARAHHQHPDGIRFPAVVTKYHELVASNRDLFGFGRLRV